MHRLLVLGTIPTPDRDSGSIDLFHTVAIFVELGFTVTFACVTPTPVGPTLVPRREPYASNLEALGVECLTWPTTWGLRGWLARHGSELRAVYVTRGRNAHRFVPQIRALAPQAKLLLHTVDLHYVREEREAELHGGVWRRWLAADSKRRELWATRNVDVAFVMSETEQSTLRTAAPGAEVRVLPLIRPPAGPHARPDARSGVLFVGGFRHRPNVDAVEYLLSELWPAVRQATQLARLPSQTLHIVGDSMPASFQRFASEDIALHGYVEDLAPLYARMRASVVPLRYGAGLKGKVATSLGFGVPCISTSIGVEGSGLVDGENVLVRDTPEGFVEALVALHANTELWQRLSDAGRAFIDSTYGIAAARARLEDALAHAGVASP